MMTRLFICLFGFWFLASVEFASTTEECHFNQYINSKLVSDYSAVLIHIETLPACLSYLKDNKLTHKVVAFDAVTHKCCSVLQGLHYEVENEANWTTFEIREENPIQPNMTTSRPSSTTVPIGLTTTTFLRTTGICTSSRTKVEPNQEQTFGLIDYNFDPCIHLESLSSANQSFCVHEITTDANYYLEVTLLYDTVQNTEYLRLIYEDAAAAFTGVGSASFKPQTSNLSVQWSTTNNRLFAKGFCLKVAAKPRETYNNKTTSGICEKGSTYVPPNQIAVLSILGDDLNACNNLNSIVFNISMSCNHKIHTDENYSLQFSVLHNIFRNDHLSLSFDSQTTNISNNGTFQGFSHGNVLAAKWNNYLNIPVPQNGFCISVMSLPKPDLSDLKTKGICESIDTYIPPGSNKTFSLNSWATDDCNHLSQLSYYASTSCFHTFHTDNDHVLNVYSLYNIGSDRLQLPQMLYTRVLSGSNEYHGSFISSAAEVLWTSEKSGNGSGFCIQVSSLPRVKNVSSTVTGICNTARSYLLSIETKAFSIESNDGSCESLDGLNYRPYTDCWHELYADDDYVLKIDALYNTSFDQLVLFADSPARRIVNGDGVLFASTYNNSVLLRWSSEKQNSPAPGFCLQVTRSDREIATDLVTKSICKSGRTFVSPDKPAIFSVLGYEFDAYSNFSNISYPNNYECRHEIYTENGYTLDFSVKYSTQTGFDFLQVFYASQVATLTGENTYIGYFNEPSMLLRWKSDSATSRQGFAMNVKAVTAISRPQLTNSTGILGVCNTPIIYVESDKASIVSVFSYQFEQCDLQFINFYGNSQSCEATVISRGSSTNIAFDIQFATASRSDYLQIDDVNLNSSIFNQYGSSSGVAQSPLKLKWFTGAAQVQKGFCLTLRLTNVTASRAVYRENEIAGPTHRGSKRTVAGEEALSHGVCTSKQSILTLNVDKTAYFSTSTSSVSQCLRLSSFVPGDTKNCKLTVRTTGSSFDYSLEYNTESTDNLEISANSLSLGSYRGNGGVTGIFNYREITLTWSSTGATAGFCLKLVARK